MEADVYVVIASRLTISSTVQQVAVGKDSTMPVSNEQLVGALTAGGIACSEAPLDKVCCACQHTTV